MKNMQNQYMGFFKIVAFVQFVMFLVVSAFKLIGKGLYIMFVQEDNVYTYHHKYMYETQKYFLSKGKDYLYGYK